MEARVAALEAANSKTQLLLEAIQRLLEDKFASIDKRLDSIESRRESSDQTCPPPSEEDDGDGCRRRGGLDHRERERVSPLENHMPFIKMDFPRFNDGDDPIGWVYKAEQYFDYFSVPPEKKVKMISFHLDREALQWYQWEECASSCSSWEDFVKVFCREFGSHGFEDFAEALFKLRQTGSLKDYITEFRRLATRIGDLNPTLQLSCFIGGLREELKHNVKLLRPATVHEAMNFAHEVDAKFHKLRLTHSSSGISNSRLPQSPLQHDVVPARTRTEITSGKDMPFKKLTPEEIQYERQNNLCFYCDEKFMRGHKCARKQVLLLDMGYNSSEEEEIAQELQ
uniref:Retrotransposon gag domain-containing protein n=1 Tax=Salix viminalis TaxID=40686 RepID=A0A6N2KFS7_SALVM